MESGTVATPTMPELKQEAEAVATALREAAELVPTERLASSGGGSSHRMLSDDVRMRFVKLRTHLFRIGVFDPVLARFDSATVPQASTSELADELSAIAGSL